MDKISEILKNDLNKNTGIDFSFNAETLTFNVIIEKNIQNNNIFIINGQAIKQEDRNVAFEIEIHIIGDFDECWIASDNNEEKIPISIIGYKVTAIESDIKSEVVDFCEAAYCVEDVYNNIKEICSF